MEFSLGLALKTIGSVAAIATPTALAVVHRDRITSWYKGEGDLSSLLEKLEINSCTVTNNAVESCSLTKEKLESINFSNRKEDKSKLNVTDNANATLKVEKTSDKDIFPNGFKFTFTASTAKIEIKKESSSDEGKIVLEVSTPVEFKIKTYENNSDKYSLEKAWSAESLTKKVGLECSSWSEKKCTLSTSMKLNVWKAEGDYVTDATVGGNDGKLIYAEDTKDYNQGFKFTVESDVTISGGTKSKNEGGISKLCKDNSTYEIGIKKINNEDKWFLIEKSS